MTLKVCVQGGASVTLGPGDFVAQGGQARIYARDGLAYKIYHDPAQVPGAGKLAQLRAIACPQVIVPSGLVLDTRTGAPAGCVMPFVTGARPLCTAFPTAFQQRHGLDPAALMTLARALRDALEAVHAANVLAVDLNDMNVLLDAGLAGVHLIDTDGFQTPGHPAAALDPAVHDWHAGSRGFGRGTDWFAFAIVTFELFVGIHPYRGKHPQVLGLEARMRANLSVLNPAVSVPPACRPFDVVPPAWRDWYEGVFEHAEREPPPAPGAAGARPLVQTPTQRGGALVLTALFDVGEAVGDFAERHGVKVVRTVRQVYVDGRATGVVGHSDAVTAWTHPGGEPVLAHAADGRLVLTPLDGGEPAVTTLAAGAVMAHEGELFVRLPGRLVRVRVLRASGGLLAAVHGVAARLTEHACVLFPGGLVQDLLGAAHVTVLTAAGACHQVRVPELDGRRIVAARYHAGVLMALTGARLVYRRTVVRFDAAHRDYDVRVEDDVDAREPTFVTLASGLCVALRDGLGLELFAARAGTGSTTILDDERLVDGARLVPCGGGVALVRGDSVHELHHGGRGAAGS